MKIQHLILSLIYVVSPSLNLSAQTGWTVAQFGSANSSGYFESTDTISYEPVLGADGKTYINAAEAQAAGMSNWTASEGSNYGKVLIAEPDITWIEYLELNGMHADQVNLTEGYQDQSNYIFDLFRNYENHLFLNAQQGQNTCEMSWTIWIDFNENHKFEMQEIVFVGAEAQQEIELRLPPDLQREFITRMRIAWAPTEKAKQTDSIAMGNVKDVSVYIQ